ncbi:glycosyltransferase [Lithospermum erythrorhizon]|uniref:Hexosyltransferase n=1 Tax=Lithospermum erythrorhizon TaxID=34254 RepID=A0AAV3REH6_LITER
MIKKLLQWQNSGEINKKMRVRMVMNGKVIFMLCIASFFAGTLFTNRPWNHSLNNNNEDHLISNIRNHVEKLGDNNVPYNCDHSKRKLAERGSGDVIEEVRKTHEAIRSLDKTVSTLEMEIAAARVKQAGHLNYSAKIKSNHTIQKAFVVIGINTAFSSKKRRESLRDTWMPKGEKLQKLEKEKGIIMRFVIGHSSTPGGVLDKAIDAENAEYNDFLILDHVEGYHELSTKTRLYFSTAVSMWDADFYVKVDDDVHLNIGTLVSTLARHRSRPRIYIGCMKSGPVLFKRDVKYHEPEHWKFGEEGNKYFRHATGQLYAISKDLATYISINSDILHRFANEDVTLGSWLLGLEVEHIDEKSMCCGTPPDCEWKALAGNVCVASFDWPCSGICKSVERMRRIHSACGEGDRAVWNVDL